MTNFPTIAKEWITDRPGHVLYRERTIHCMQCLGHSRYEAIDFYKWFKKHIGRENTVKIGTTYRPIGYDFIDSDIFKVKRKRTKDPRTIMEEAKANKIDNLDIIRSTRDIMDDESTMTMVSDANSSFRNEMKEKGIDLSTLFKENDDKSTMISDAPPN